MLADISNVDVVYIICSYTNLRRGIEGLARSIRFQFELDPYDRYTLFLFCERRCEHIKTLLGIRKRLPGKEYQ